jgi:hypothetical protein
MIIAKKAWQLSMKGVKAMQFFNKPICVALAATQTPGNTDQVSSSTWGFFYARKAKARAHGRRLACFVQGNLGR